MYDDLTFVKSQKAFKATDVPAENIVKNGNFSKDSDGDGLADDWVKGSNVTNTRIEGNTQYWTNNNGFAWSGRIAQDIKIQVGHKFYVNATTSNVYGLYFGGKVQGNFGQVLTVNEKINDELWVYAAEANLEAFIKNIIVLDLTKLFGTGNEPTAEQMNRVLEQFTDSWFDGTKNVFSAQHFMSMYFKKMTELDNAITNLGGGTV
ncbi:hypothetical protein KK120_08690 [Virgibacillus dakarensis]|nr:hypothetical protein [Virgibacillus dakarensis]MBT2215898.1 hypothetical protein [Virgibacillus dakarensis]